VKSVGHRIEPPLAAHASGSKPFFSKAEMEAAIDAAPEVAVSDAENPPTTPEDWEIAIDSHSLPELREKLAVRRRGPGRAPLKVPTTIRFDPEVLAALRTTGRGWQTRVNDVMKEWVAQNIPG
jgi:uncharacterized protein (DUF4415 family)